MADSPVDPALRQDLSADSPVDPALRQDLSADSPVDPALRRDLSADSPVDPVLPEDISTPRQGLLVDWGGVMTSNLFAAFTDFCTAEGLDPQALAGAFAKDRDARDALIGFEEGRIEEAEFEAGLASRLGLASPEGLIDRLFSGAQPEEAMIGAVRAARACGIKTGLISNSWGTTRYPRDLLAELFEGVVISGEVGIRKPAPRIYELGAEAIGLPPSLCVFVDDLPFNLPPAEELGMAVVHHIAPEATIEALERLLGVSLLAVER